MVSSLYKYRTFILRNALADVRHRYAGTGMGVVWNVLHPLGLILIYSLVFTGIMSGHMDASGNRFAYTMYLCAGFFPWIAFSECLTRGCGAFSANASYLKKLLFME
jgi:ABC-type polysaccharide/polyol phosphate export permease